MPLFFSFSLTCVPHTYSYICFFLLLYNTTTTTTTEAPLEYHPLFETGPKDIGPAIRHLDEVRAVSPQFFELFSILIGALELNRALVGWVAPTEQYESGLTLKADYYPGDGTFER